MRPLNKRNRVIGWKHGFENNYRISSQSCLKKNNEAGRFYESVKRGGTAEVDAYRFRPHKELTFMERSDRRFF